MTKRRSKKSFKRKTYRRLKTSKRRNTRRRRSIRRKSRRRRKKMRGGSLKDVSLPDIIFQPGMIQTNEYHPYEYLIEKGQEDLFAELLRRDDRPKIPLIMSGHHSEMGGGNFTMQRPCVFHVVKVSIGHYSVGRPTAIKREIISQYKILEEIKKIRDSGEDIVSDSGCAHKDLIKTLTDDLELPKYFVDEEETQEETQEIRKAGDDDEEIDDIENINVKIYGRSEDLEEDLLEEGLPEVLSEEDIGMVSPDILQKYVANEMILVFEKERFFRNHGLVAQLMIGGHLFKFRYRLTTDDEPFSEDDETKKASDVHKVLNSLQEKTCVNAEDPSTGKQLECFFTDCRTRADSLTHELSRRTDKSIQCWLERYSQFIPSSHRELFEIFLKKHPSMSFFYSEYFPDSRFAEDDEFDLSDLREVLRSGDENAVFNAVLRCIFDITKHTDKSGLLQVYYQMKPRAWLKLFGEHLGENRVSQFVKKFNTMGDLYETFTQENKDIIQNFLDSPDIDKIVSGLVIKYSIE